MTQKNEVKQKQSLNGSYTIADIEEILDISRPTAIALVKQGHFPLFKVKDTYRVKKVDFEKWFESEDKEGNNG